MEPCPYVMSNESVASQDVDCLLWGHEMIKSSLLIVSMPQHQLYKCFLQEKATAVLMPMKQTRTYLALDLNRFPKALPYSQHNANSSQDQYKDGIAYYC